MRSYLVKWYFCWRSYWWDPDLTVGNLTICKKNLVPLWQEIGRKDRCWYLLMGCKKLRAVFPPGSKILRSLLVMNGVVLGGDPNRGEHIENVYFVNGKECWLGKWKNCRQFWRHTLEPRQNIIKIPVCAGELINHFIVSINRNNLIDPHSRHFIMSLLE